MVRRRDGADHVFRGLGLLHAVRGIERRPDAGKQLLGIRVVMDTGRSITPAAALIRNLVRILDCYFPIPFAPR